MSELDVPSMSREMLEQWIATRLAEELGLAPEEVDVTAPFASFGVSSIVGVSLAGAMADALDVDVPATLFWDYPTIEKLAAYLQQLAARP